MNKVSIFAQYLLNKYSNISDSEDKKESWQDELEELEEIDEGWEDTVFQDVEDISPPPTILPLVVQDFLSDLNYMDREDLLAERKRIREIINQFATDGIKIPYPLKMRQEEIERRLK